MSLDPMKLAKATVSWLQFECLCDRESLLTEASMTQPLGQILMTNSQHPILPEEPHPVLPKRTNPPALDFAIKRPDGSFSLAMETKWINDKRTVTQEIANDLLRLELVHTPNHQIDRWLLVAGQQKYVKKRVFEVSVNNAGTSRSLFATGLLPRQVDSEVTVDVEGSTGGMGKMWKKAPHLVRGNAEIWPHAFKVKLMALYPSTPSDEDLTCYIWQVGRQQRRKDVSL